MSSHGASGIGGQQIVVIEKVKDLEDRAWYGRAAVEHGWSRSALVHQIESGFYRRKGQATTNFARTLPAPQSDLAHEMLKDPCPFCFLDLARVMLVQAFRRTNLKARPKTRESAASLSLAIPSAARSTNRDWI